MDWVIIHYVSDDGCAFCGKPETSFLPFICNAHTHGMSRYGLQDFQLVLKLAPQEIGRILNTIAYRVSAGERFKARDMVEGIYTDCKIRLDEFEETGRMVLRLIIPDGNGLFPESPVCMVPYRFQLLKTEDLFKEKKHESDDLSNYS